MMRMIYKILISAVFVLLLAWFGWWAFGRSPQSQVLARQAAFISALEERDWSAIKAMLTDDYSDDYGHNRDSLIEDARTVFGRFISLTVNTELVSMQAVPDLAMVKMKFKMEGRGLGFSDLVISRVNGINQPWFFHWHKKGRWPWDWKIVQIHNDDLRLPTQ